jgi:hypothetical protein
VAGAFSPLDEELALPAGQLSSFVVETLVRLATWLPFGRASAEVARLTGVQVAASTVRRLTEGAGTAYEGVQTAQVAALERATPPPADGPAVQALAVDGVMVPLVGGTWAEVRTLAIGTVQARKPGQHARPHQAMETVALSYFSRMTDHETFTRLALVETQRRGTETAGTGCALFDGALWIQTFLDHHRPDAVRILDWPHAVGYLGGVARALYGLDSPPAKAWLAQQKDLLLRGEVERVLAELASLQALLGPVAAGEQERLVWTLAGPGASDPPWQGVLGREGAAATLAVVTESLEYLRKRAAMLCYADFRAAGYPIGSGSVESANKLLVQARLKGAGMRWAPAHVNPMLALRTIAASDRWAEAWPLIVTAQQQARQTRTTQRRTARQEDERACQAAAQAEDDRAHRAAPAATMPPPPSPARPAAHPATRARTPAPDHPWRHAVLNRPRSA